MTTSQPASSVTPQTSENAQQSGSSVFGGMQLGGWAALPAPASDPSVSAEASDSRLEMTPIRAPSASLPQSKNQVVIFYSRHMVCILITGIHVSFV